MNVALFARLRAMGQIKVRRRAPCVPCCGSEHSRCERAARIHDRCGCEFCWTRPSEDQLTGSGNGYKGHAA